MQPALTIFRCVARIRFRTLTQNVLHIHIPKPRAVTTDVFRSSTAVGTEQSVLFASWGLLMVIDMVYNIDNRTEPFDIPCDDGGGFDDVWCPLGMAASRLTALPESRECVPVQPLDSGQVIDVQY